MVWLCVRYINAQNRSKPLIIAACMHTIMPISLCLLSINSPSPSSSSSPFHFPYHPSSSYLWSVSPLLWIVLQYRLHRHRVFLLSFSLSLSSLLHPSRSDLFLLHSVLLLVRMVVSLHAIWMGQLPLQVVILHPSPSNSRCRSDLSDCPFHWYISVHNSFFSFSSTRSTNYFH